MKKSKEEKRRKRKKEKREKRKRKERKTKKRDRRKRNLERSERKDFFEGRRELIEEIIEDALKERIEMLGIWEEWEREGCCVSRVEG